MSKTTRYSFALCVFALLGGAVGGCGAAPESEASETEDIAFSDEALSIGMECRAPQGEVLGACGPNANMLVACDQRFVASCKGAGGDTYPCGGGACAGMTVWCDDDSDLLHDCDKKFKQACKDGGGDFSCVTEDCDMGKCTGL